jgi:hypothetical protein
LLEYKGRKRAHTHKRKRLIAAKPETTEANICPIPVTIFLSGLFAYRFSE